MSEENKAIYRRMSEEVWNQGHPDRAGEFFASDVVIHSAQPGTPPGIAGVTATARRMSRVRVARRMGRPLTQSTP